MSGMQQNESLQMWHHRGGMKKCQIVEITHTPHENETDRTRIATDWLTFREILNGFRY